MTEIDEVDSRVDDVDSRVDDVEENISNLEDDIQILKEDFNIWGLFNERMIPYVYDNTLHKLLEKLEQTNYKQTLDCFRVLNNKFDIPYSLNIQKYRKNKRILRCTTFLKNSKEFFDAAKVATFDTKPIFYYYSISYLFAFLLESFVDFDKPKLHHGIYVNTDNGIGHMRFTYNLSGGFFERLVHTLSMLQFPSSFSSFIIDLDDKNQMILYPQKTDISISNTNSILLDKLLEYDFSRDFTNLKLNKTPAGIRHRYGKTSLILKDFVLIFTSCAIARYNPALWRAIYSGENSKLIFYFEKSFNNINEMIRLVNNIILQTEKGTLLFNLEKPIRTLFD